MVVFLIGMYFGAGVFNAVNRGKVLGSVSFRGVVRDILAWPLDLYKILKG
jgi:hypothetical protein